MFLLGVFCLIASTIAMSTSEYTTSPETLVIAIPEMELHTNLPNIQTNAEQNDHPEVITHPEHDENSSEEKKEHHIIVLPALSSPPELPPLHASVLEFLRKTEHSADFLDEEGKPHTIKWKLPKIRFPGGYISNDVYGPRISLRAIT